MNFARGVIPLEGDRRDQFFRRENKRGEGKNTMKTMMKSGKLNVNKSNTLHGILFDAITLIVLPPRPARPSADLFLTIAPWPQAAHLSTSAPAARRWVREGLVPPRGRPPPPPPPLMRVTPSRPGRPVSQAGSFGRVRRRPASGRASGAAAAASTSSAASAPAFDGVAGAKANFFRAVAGLEWGAEARGPDRALVQEALADLAGAGGAGAVDLAGLAGLWEVRSAPLDRKGQASVQPPRATD